ncbi:mercury(II) reductase [Rubrobacter calidifluminis]|uniref:mercury(II) reductase n=1 Tax=Rubrobacter calidifluminis TaxID=1392640 RepID=UPI002360D580|nr:mercury(II) reductase [Rubrobacter calidifluminis]
MSRRRMKIGGMTCSHCEVAVSRALEGAGAREVSADFRRGEAVFEDPEGVDEEGLRGAVREAGYEPRSLEDVRERRVRVETGGGGYDYDLAVIGSGSAAFAAAIRASDEGARVAMVERGTVGGTCVNVGCIPSKNLLAAAEAYHRAGSNPFRGVETTAGAVDFGALVGMKSEVVSKLRREKYEDLAAEYGFEIVRGEARFVSPEAIEVGGRRITAQSYLISTGARPWVPRIEGLEEAGYLTYEGAMELDELPGSLVVIGGNYIGLEMGQLFADLGSRVTIVEMLDRLAPGEEPEVSRWIEEVLREQGVEVITSARVERVEGGENNRLVIASSGGEERKIAASEILVATGRRPVLDGLGLEKAGIERDERGALVLDDELRTTNPRVFAAGDVTGAPQFVYVAAAQGTLAAGNALLGAGRAMDYAALPRVTFTTPNIAAVGLTDAQAHEEGYACECRMLDLENVPRAIVNLDTRGMVKLVAEKESGKVLGAHAVGENAGEIILAGVYAVKFGLTVQDLADTWAPYLTMSEGIKLAAQSFGRDVSKLSCCAA